MTYSLLVSTNLWLGCSSCQFQLDLVLFLAEFFLMLGALRHSGYVCLRCLKVGARALQYYSFKVTFLIS